MSWSPTVHSVAWAFGRGLLRWSRAPWAPGTLDLPHACARGRRLASKPFKFTLTGPHMLAKSVIDKHYGNVPDLALAIGDALAAQVRHIDADVVQIDEANLPGSPEEWQWAAAAINRVLDAVKTTPAVHLCFGNYGGQSIQQGTWENLINYLNALARRSHRDGNRASSRRRSLRFSSNCGRRSALGLA